MRVCVCETVRASFGGHEGALRVLAALQRMHKGDSAWAAAWSHSCVLGAAASEQASPDLISNTALHAAGLSSALYY